MISFIIIGRNEGWKLTLCLKSVLDAILKNNISKYEIIYVDSNSTDDSIKKTKKYNKIKIIKLTDDHNSAIARNIGALESIGETLFFIDGDMEIQADFLHEVFNEISGLKFDFVSGDFINVNYDTKGNIQNKARYFKNERLLIQQEVGGLFLIKREKWNLVNGMRNEFIKSQDVDLALRLAKKNILLRRLPLIAAYHHTIPYKNFSRMWKDFQMGSHLYARSLLYRRNLLNKYMYKRIFMVDYSLIVLIVSFMLSFLSIYSLLLYLSVIAFRSLNNSKRIVEILNFSLFYFCRDTTVLLGLVFFWPKTPSNINYTRSM